MQKAKFFIIGVLLLTVAGVLSHASYAATANGDADANVITPLTIVGRTPLNFGRIEPNDNEGDVTISTSGSRASNGAISFGPEAFSQATFQIRGEPNRLYTINVPSAQSFVSSDAASYPTRVSTLSVDRFIVQSQNNISGGVAGRINSSGNDVVHMGGTLYIPANAAPGVYSGIVPLTVSY